MSEMADMLMNDIRDAYDIDDCYDYRATRIKRTSNQNLCWKTMDGRIIDLKDMTDSHLENAIKYSERHNKSQAVELLTQEKNRRKDQIFFNETIKCQFCGKDMKRKTCESDPEEGVGMGWIKYAFTCSCGATGPLHDKPA